MKTLFITTEWPFGHQPFRAPFVKVLFDALQAEHGDIHLYAIPIGRSIARILDQRAVLSSIIDKGNFRHIHAYGLLSLFLVPHRFLHRCSVSLMGSDVMGHPTASGRYPVFDSLMVRFMARRLRRTAGWRAVSKPLWHKAQQWAVTSVPSLVLPNPIQFDYFPQLSQNQARQHLGLDPLGAYVVFPSNTQRAVKNFTLAQRIMEEARRLTGSHDPKLLVPNKVTHREMNLYFRAANLTLLTSFHEGSPSVAKESLYCGVPLLSTPVGDVPELLQETQMGRIFNINDSLTQVALVLLEMLGSDQYNVGRGQAYCQEVYGPELIAQKLWAFWRGLPL
jgi:glycosyltransferase involved in cell wall biosynthesis